MHVSPDCCRTFQQVESQAGDYHISMKGLTPESPCTSVKNQGSYLCDVTSDNVRRLVCAGQSVSCLWSPPSRVPQGVVLAACYPLSLDITWAREREWWLMMTLRRIKKCSHITGSLVIGKKLIFHASSSLTSSPTLLSLSLFLPFSKSLFSPK